MSASRRGSTKSALGITAIYVAVASLWIVFSDRFVARFAGDAGGAADLDGLTRLQSVKGIAFVLASGLMLYVLIRRGLKASLATDDQLREASEARDAEAERYRSLVARTSDEAARTREARLRLEEQLRQSQKMEAVGLLAGGVAHDFNNLLVAISGYAELALAQVPDGSPVREELDGIREAVERGAGLTRQLLALSRRQVLEPAPLDLNAVLVDLGRMLPRVLGGQVELSLRTEANPGTVMADLSQVEQLVLNLCVNARDAMPQGGRLMLQTESVRPLSPGAGPAGAGRRVALIVSDTGMGMDAATRERIFEPFFTTKPAGQGTGLGLSTVYAIVQQSGGTIACSSTPGRGTSFRIELPLVSGELAQAEAVPDGHARGTESALLVDDDACALETTERALLRHGYNVLTARDLPAGLAAVQAGGGPLRIVVVRAHLAEGDGESALQRLRSSHADLAVLLVTSREHLAHSAATPGASLLAMPFTSLELAMAVRRALDLGTEPPAKAASTRERSTRAGELPKLSVLVVDDDSQVCRVVREMLETAGHSVLVAQDGAEALTLLRTTPVDVVLCDMLMPEKEGLETCNEIRRRHPGLPFVAMSGAPGGSNYMRIAVKLGATGSLAKPFTRQDLLHALDRALSVRQD